MGRWDNVNSRSLQFTKILFFIERNIKQILSYQTERELPGKEIQENFSTQHLLIYNSRVFFLLLLGQCTSIELYISRNIPGELEVKAS